MSYKKVGGLHFVRLGRFGFSFFWSAKRRAPRTPRSRKPVEWGGSAALARLRDFDDATRTIHTDYFRG